MAIAALSGWPTRDAHAQSCHCQHEAGASQDGLDVRALVVAGGHVGRDVNFVGLGVDSALTYERFDAQLTFVGYRLARDGQGAFGPGDLSVSARAIVFRTSERPWVIAVGGRAMVPTTSAARGFGMGHLMLGPEVRVSKNFGLHDVFLTLNYLHDVPGTSLGTHDHGGAAPADHHDHGAHHAAPSPSPSVWPDVDPHNMSELAVMAGGSFGLGAGWSLRASGLALVPIAVDDGAYRVAVIPGAAWSTGPVQVSLDVEATVLGSPWLFRGFLAVRYRWSLA